MNNDTEMGCDPMNYECNDYSRGDVAEIEDAIEALEDAEEALYDILVMGYLEEDTLTCLALAVVAAHHVGSCNAAARSLWGRLC